MEEVLNREPTEQTDCISQPEWRAGPHRARAIARAQQYAAYYCCFHWQKEFFFLCPPMLQKQLLALLMIRARREENVWQLLPRELVWLICTMVAEMAAKDAHWQRCEYHFLPTEWNSPAIRLKNRSNK